jgi:hypothetical protein
MATPPTFKCGTCGGDTFVEPPDGPAICEACCGKSEDGHEWSYSRDDGQWLCERCNGMPPPDFYDGWFDD